MKELAENNQNDGEVKHFVRTLKGIPTLYEIQNNYELKFEDKFQHYDNMAIG